MDADNVFPADMPDDHLQPPVSKPMVPLDDDTAERLLAGHLHPEDAALAGFRAAGRGPTVAAGRRVPTGAGGRRRRTRVRASLVALALAGTLVVGAVWLGGGVGTADGALTALGLRSPPGGLAPAGRVELGRCGRSPPPSPAAGRRACPRPVSGRPLAMAAR